MFYHIKCFLHYIWLVNILFNFTTDNSYKIWICFELNSTEEIIAKILFLKRVVMFIKIFILYHPTDIAYFTNPQQQLDFLCVNILELNYNFFLVLYLKIPVTFVYYKKLYVCVCMRVYESKRVCLRVCERKRESTYVHMCVHYILET